MVYPSPQPPTTPRTERLAHLIAEGSQIDLQGVAAAIGSQDVLRHLPDPMARQAAALASWLSGVGSFWAVSAASPGAGAERQALALASERLLSARRWVIGCAIVVTIAVSTAASTVSWVLAVRQYDSAINTLETRQRSMDETLQTISRAISTLPR